MTGRLRRATAVTARKSGWHAGVWPNTAPDPGRIDKYGLCHIIARMKKTTFAAFMNDLVAEARSEGPQAIAQLERLQHRYFLGGQIAMLRARQGITQEELETKTGIGQTEISRIEPGLGNPTEDTPAKAGYRLGVRLAYVSERDPVAF